MSEHTDRTTSLSYESRRRETQVSLVEGRIVKRYSPADVLLEYKRAVALWECSVTGGFVAPRPLAIREADSTIEYEFLPELVSVRECYIELLKSEDFEGEAARCIRAVGVALAQIHKHLNVSPAIPWKMPPAFEKGLMSIGVRQPNEFLAKSPQALLHGDFGFSNLYIRRSPDIQIVVLDASPNHFVTLAPNERGSVYLDLGHFTACLDGLVPVRFYPWLHWPILNRVKELFWSAYEEAAGISLERRWIALVAYADAYTYFAARFGDGLRSKIAMKILYNKFKGNLP